MTSLVVMLFFGATGILLNHESWTLGTHTSERIATGTVPASSRSGSTFDTLTLEQYAVDHAGISGPVTGQGLNGTQLWVTYQGPGYSARLSADTSTGAYKVVEDKQGLVGVLDDVHRAKNTGTTWRVVNDLAGVLLVFIGLTGLLITWLSRARNRRRDLALAVAGLVLAGVALWTAIG